jgi:hypothetical protein
MSGRNPFCDDRGRWRPTGMTRNQSLAVAVVGFCICSAWFLFGWWCVCQACDWVREWSQF